MEYRYGLDEERTVKKGSGWEKFKLYLSNKNPTLNIDKLLEPPNIKKESVSSCGLIEFVETRTSVSYHVFRRRHTLEFDILVKGTAPKYQLFDLISLLSKDERERIKNNSIEKIWEDYWVDDSHNEISQKFRNKLEEVKNILIELDDSIPCLIEERPFIFAKGRPNNNETGLEAALREAKEETKHDYDLNDHSTGYLYFNSPIVQNYLGSDNNPYADYYYIWKSPEVYKSKLQQLTYKEGNSARNITISHELESDAWIEIPKFKSTKELLEWQRNLNSYSKYKIFKRQFHAILEIHSHLNQTE